MPEDDDGDRDASRVQRLARFPGTIALAAVLLGTFLAQILVAIASGPTAVTGIFAAGPEPSPGWLLAPFAHQGPQHLFVNLLLVVAYGAVVEAVLGTRRQLGLFLAAGWAATAAVVVAFHLTAVEGHAAGASGSGFAFVAVVTVVTLARIDRQSIGHPVHVLGLAGIPLLGVQVVADVAFAGGAGWIAHLVGGALGVAVGVWAIRSGTVSTDPPRRPAVDRL